MVKESEAPKAELSSAQARLVRQKLDVLGKARKVQAELAGVRAELTRIDQKMLAAGFDIPVAACW